DGGRGPGGVAQGGVPVPGGQFPGGGLAGGGGGPGDGGGGGEDAGGFRQGVPAQGVPPGGGGGGVDVEAAGEDLVAVEAVQQVLQRFGVPGEDGGAVAVDGGDGHPAAGLGDACFRVARGECDDGHGAGAGQAGEGLAAQGDDGRRV